MGCISPYEPTHGSFGEGRKYKRESQKSGKVQTVRVDNSENWKRENHSNQSLIYSYMYVLEGVMTEWDGGKKGEESGGCPWAFIEPLVTCRGEKCGGEQKKFFWGCLRTYVILPHLRGYK